MHKPLAEQFAHAPFITGHGVHSSSQAQHAHCTEQRTADADDDAGCCAIIVLSQQVNMLQEATTADRHISAVQVTVK